MPKGPKPRSSVERVLARIEVTASGCWEFQGAKNKHGYGVVMCRPGGTKAAYVVVWEAVHGPKPKGSEASHVCENPACVNPGPEHVVMETHAENMARSMKIRQRVDRCLNGHLLTPENRRGRNGTKGCRQCRNDRKRELYAQGR
jgi:hypothetical protein